MNHWQLEIKLLKKTLSKVRKFQLSALRKFSPATRKPPAQPLAVHLTEGSICHTLSHSAPWGFYLRLSLIQLHEGSICDSPSFSSTGLYLLLSPSFSSMRALFTTLFLIQLHEGSISACLLQVNWVLRRLMCIPVSARVNFCRLNTSTIKAGQLSRILWTLTALQVPTSSRSPGCEFFLPLA